MPIADRSSSVKSASSNPPSSRNASTAKPRRSAARVTASKSAFASMASVAPTPAFSTPAVVRICSFATSNWSMNRNSLSCLNGVAPFASGNAGSFVSTVFKSFSSRIGKNLRSSDTRCITGSRTVVTMDNAQFRSRNASRNASRCFSNINTPGVLMWCAMTYAPRFPPSMDRKTRSVTPRTFSPASVASLPKPYTFRFFGKSST